jgi:hypothetical protein
MEERTRAFERGHWERRWRIEGREVFVVGHDIPFCNGEVPVEDPKELALHSTDVFFGESAGPSSPPSVFDCVIGHILTDGYARQRADAGLCARMTSTFAARTSAPIKILSHAHRSSDILNWGLARSRYTRATRMTGVSTRDLRMTSSVNWRKGRGMAEGAAKRWEVGRPRAKSTVSIVVRTRYSKNW